jgi:putative ABC transport system ATP-binding protein
VFTEGFCMAQPAAFQDGDPCLLRAEKVSKLYPDGNVSALVDVSLEIRRGEYVAIMGPSGSGKSTLLNLIGALDTPTSGEVYFDGRPLSGCTSTELDRLRSQRIGFVFQSFHLLPTLTAAENVQIPMFELPFTPRQRSAKAEELLKLVDMSHRVNHLPSKLSVGERQRVAIARSLANDPILLLADEPTGNLDSRRGAEILELFARLHQERGTTLVVITHGQEVAEQAQRVVRVKDGRIDSDTRNAAPAHAAQAS